MGSMRTTTLGRQGPEVGVIGLGCMGMTHSYDMAAPRDDATSISVVHQALDLGMTLIDTADAYGPYTNEELVAARWRAETANARCSPQRSASSPAPSRWRILRAPRPARQGTAAPSTFA